MYKFLFGGIGNEKNSINAFSIVHGGNNACRHNDCFR